MKGITIIDESGNVAYFEEYGCHFHLKTITSNKGKVLFDIDNEIDEYFESVDKRTEFIKTVYRIYSKNLLAISELSQAFYGISR